MLFISFIFQISPASSYRLSVSKIFYLPTDLYQGADDCVSYISDVEGFMTFVVTYQKLRRPKINFGTPTVEMFQKPLWACLGMPDHAHLVLSDQFVTLLDLNLHALNKLYKSISF